MLLSALEGSCLWLLRFAFWGCPRLDTMIGLGGNGVARWTIIAVVRGRLHNVRPLGKSKPMAIWFNRRTIGLCRCERLLFTHSESEECLLIRELGRS